MEKGVLLYLSIFPLSYLSLVSHASTISFYRSKRFWAFSQYFHGVSLSGMFHAPLLHSSIPPPGELRFCVVFHSSLDSSVIGFPNTMHLS